MKTLTLVASSLVLASTPALADEKFRATLHGYNEVPSVSTAARGSFEATLGRDGVIDYELSYRGLQGNVTQAHIHFAQRHTNGGIVVWLCQTATNQSPVPSTPVCPPSTENGVTVTGSIRASDVIGSNQPPQQLVAGELDEVIAAMRADAAYVNVHTSLSPGGEIRGQIGDRGRGRGHRH